MRLIIFVLASALICYSTIGQERTNVYVLPGQGADCRLFAELELDTSTYALNCLSYGIPGRDETMSSFAKNISKYIDTTKPFILIGTSLGGMLAVEIAHYLTPDQTIIISSAKERKELPLRYKFQRMVPIYAMFPPQVLKKGALALQPIVEPDRNKYEQTFVSMLSDKPNIYYQRSIGLIINWERTNCERDIIHLHGDNDHTIPIRNIENAIVVEGGSHMMTLTSAEKISKILNAQLN